MTNMKLSQVKHFVSYSLSCTWFSSKLQPWVIIQR